MITQFVRLLGVMAALGLVLGVATPAMAAGTTPPRAGEAQLGSCGWWEFWCSDAPPTTPPPTPPPQPASPPAAPAPLAPPPAPTRGTLPGPTATPSANPSPAPVPTAPLDWANTSPTGRLVIVLNAALAGQARFCVKGGECHTTQEWLDQLSSQKFSGIAPPAPNWWANREQGKVPCPVVIAAVIWMTKARLEGGRVRFSSGLLTDENIWPRLLPAGAAGNAIGTLADWISYIRQFCPEWLLVFNDGAVQITRPGDGATQVMAAVGAVAIIGVTTVGIVALMPEGVAVTITWTALRAAAPAAAELLWAALRAPPPFPAP